jgi:benzylsuccinate CoA-transferase BbsF subunit
MDKKSVFQGVKVVEWTQSGAGPWGGRCFADFGAEVIKVESTKFPDFIRLSLPYKDGIPGVDRAFSFLLFNTGKESFTLDLKSPRGQEIFKKLVGWADIVLQNQRPGLMKGMGLGYEELKKVKEDIILIDVSITGQEGPWTGTGGWGGNAMAQTGHTYLYCHPGGEPLMPGFTATTDAIIPMYQGMAGIAALAYKRKTGKGQHIDMAQLETSLYFLSTGILDYAVNNRVQQPMGNRDPRGAPHNAFLCKGDDKWCAIAVFTDEEWEGFCKVLGNPEWTMSHKFATLAARKDNEDELEKLINEWTINHTPKEVMAMMQEAGVPAGVLQTTEDIVDLDPQVKARELLPKRRHPVMGECLHTRWPFILSKTPGEIRTAPCLGEHNYYVCTEILGMSDEEFAELASSEVLQ